MLGKLIFMVVERAVRIDLASVLPAVVSGFWIRYQLAFVFPCAGRRFPGSHYSGFRGLPRPVVLQRSSHILNVVVGCFFLKYFFSLYLFICVFMQAAERSIANSD